jgi:O-antigen/teichoic acid export membrane protein
MSNSLRQFFLGGLSLSIVNISGKIVNLLILPILTYYLLPSDFGIIAIYFLVIEILCMFYNPGIISVTIRLYYDNDDNSDDNRILVGSAVLFLLILPLLIIVFSLFFGEVLFDYFFKDFNYWPFGFFAVMAAITPQIVRLWSTLWVAKHKTQKVAIVSLVRIFLAVFISLVLIVWFKMGAMGRIIGLFVGNVAIFTIAVYDIIKYTRFRVSFRNLLRTLVLGLPLVFSVFSYVIMNSSDKYMLEQMVGLSELGIYDIAYTYSAIPLFLIVGFSQVWQPIFFENMKKGSHNILLMLSNYYIIVFSLISLAVIVFSNEIFNLFINQKYINAIQIIPWIVIGVYFLGLTNLIASIYSYQKRFKEIGFISIIVAVLNIILNYALILEFGLAGAAIATSISYFAYFSILFFRAKRDILIIFSIKGVIGAISLLISGFVIILYINNNTELSYSHTSYKICTMLFIILSLFLFKIIGQKDRLLLSNLFKRD